jgi:hypothetical protein
MPRAGPCRRTASMKYSLHPGTYRQLPAANGRSNAW